MTARLDTPPFASIVGFGVVSLAFFQLLSEYTEAVFAFGLLGVELPPELATVALFLAPALLVVGGGRPASATGLRLLLLLALAARLAAPLLGTRARLYAAGIGLLVMLIVWPLILAAWPRRGRSPAEQARIVSAGLALALATSAAARALQSGYDSLICGWGQVAMWLAVAFAIPWSWRALARPADVEEPSAEAPPPSGPRLLGLALGTCSLWATLYFCLASPGVMSRWTGSNYLVVLGAALGSLVAHTWLGRRVPALARPSRRGLLIGNALFFGGLALALAPHQLSSPDAPGAYPFEAPAAPAWSVAAFFVALVTWPVLLVTFSAFAGAIRRARSSRRALGLCFALASTLWLALILGQIFSLIHEYIPGIGPLLKGRFVLITTLPGVGVALGLLALRPGDDEAEDAGAPAPAVHAWSVTALACAAVLAAVIRSPRVDARRGDDTLRVFTFNAQQGYTGDGARGHHEQLALLRSLDADVIGLSECDNSRVTGGNADLVRFFADSLGMHSYRGPTTVAGTYGLALLSRAPIRDARTIYVESVASQNAVIVATVELAGEPVTIAVTHLGNDGPELEHRSLLQALEGRERVILMGDFNARPGSPAHRLVTATLDDAFERGTSASPTDWRHDDEIDHVYVSPALAVTELVRVPPGASDHPGLLATISVARP